MSFSPAREPNGQYHCPYCTKSFRDELTQKGHIEYEHRLERDEADVVRANGDHQESKDIDTSSESESGGYVDDNVAHVFEDPKVCLECDEKYSLRYDDFNEKGKIPDWKLSCNLCDKLFVENSKFELHGQAVHEVNHPEHCKLCGKQFECTKTRRRSGFSELLMSSNQVSKKRFSCKQCSKRFAQRIGLEIHLRVHAARRPHICKECLKRFSERDQLMTHIKSVHPYLFHCDYCTKRFHTKEEVTEHLQTHQLIQCEHCDKKTTQRNMMAHVKAYHRKSLQSNGDVEDHVSYPESPPRRVTRSERANNTDPFIGEDGSVTKCLCGNNSDLEGFMIQCEECSVWQHAECVGIDMENVPEKFYCEVCDSGRGN